MAIIHPPTTPVAAAPAHAPAAPPAPPIDLLLVESDFLVRRTVAAVARDMRLANPQEATSVEAAERLLATHAFDALFLSLEDRATALALVNKVRLGDTLCPADTPVAVTAEACDTTLALQLKTLDVRRLLLRPFKVKGLLEAIAALRDAAAAAPVPQGVKPNTLTVPDAAT